jgi:hypothetical protein
VCVCVAKVQVCKAHTLAGSHWPALPSKSAKVCECVCVRVSKSACARARVRLSLSSTLTVLSQCVCYLLFSCTRTLLQSCLFAFLETKSEIVLCQNIALVHDCQSLQTVPR